MGVKGLSSFVNTQEDYRDVSIKSLAEENKAEGSPVLVVDGHNFITSWYANPKESLECIYGGQWIQFKEILEKFVSKFESVSIKLLFIFDGTICAEKLQAWKKRRMDGYDEIKSIFSAILKDPEEVISSRQALKIPMFLAKYALKELKEEERIKEKVDVYQTGQEVDPDNYIAGYANKNENVFAILSEDTDFLIFDTKPILSISDLNLEKLTTKMYDRCCLAKRLDISTIQLPLFACLMGNDFIPHEKLKRFHDSLTINEKKTEKKAKIIINLGKKIKRMNWKGIKGKELSSISLEVFGHKNESSRIERGIESYIIKKAAPDLTLSVEMSGDFQKEVRERHLNCSNSCIFNLLCKKEYGSGEVLEEPSRKASALVYREIRQRCYGVLFNCFVESNKVKSIVIQERCWYQNKIYKNNDLNKPEKIQPLPLSSISEVIKVEDLWFNCSEKIRFEYFWRILQIPMDFELLIKLPEDEVVLSCILNYLIGGLKSGPLLKPLDVAVFVAQALWKPNALALKQLKKPEVDSDAVNLSTLFVNGIEPVLMALETCGFPLPYKYAMPWRFFDGKLFHHLYNKAKMLPKVQALFDFESAFANNQDEIIKRFYRLLPIVTDNTEYDPVRFNWSNVLEDFELE